MNVIWDGDYGYAAYRKILDYLKYSFSLNYLIREIPQILSQIHRPKFVIRHDVISNPGKAVAMAEIEHELSVAAAYMFDISSEDYHPARGEAPDAIERIRDLGHEVGLFFSCTEFEEGRAPSPEAIDGAVRRSCLELEKAFRTPVFSVSLPNPHPEIPGRSLFLGSRVNAASPLMMDWFLSDTSPPWKSDEIAPRPSKPYEALLQILIHPHLWG